MCGPSLVVASSISELKMSDHCLFWIVSLATNGYVWKVLILIYCCTLSVSSLHYPWIASCVHLTDVSHNYPDSLWRRLTSSVPRREWSLEHVSLSMESEVALLVGPSSSGKTTLLKLIQEKEEPVRGNVRIGTVGDEISMNSIAACPILLDERPLLESQRTVRSILKNVIPHKQINFSQLKEDCLLQDMVELFDLDLDQTPYQLSPSQNYGCRLAEACLQSMLHNGTFNNNSIHVPAPILLLDEWMDSETSTVVQKVQLWLARLAEKGAVVIVVTHKPHLFNKDCIPAIRLVTLQRGTISSVM